VKTRPNQPRWLDLPLVEPRLALQQDLKREDHHHGIESDEHHELQEIPYDERLKPSEAQGRRAVVLVGRVIDIMPTPKQLYPALKSVTPVVEEVYTLYE
jgi:hypothetical protein